MLLIISMITTVANAEIIFIGSSHKIPLKKSASFSSKKITNLYNEDTVKIIETGKIFSKVLTEKGKTGYVQNTFIKAENKAFASGTSYNKTPIKGVITDRCNFRVGASVDTESIGTLTPGTKVIVYGSNGEYYLGMIKDKKIGFFKKTCFKKTNEKEENKSTNGSNLPKFIKTTANGVNVRQGPDKKYKSLGKLKKNTYVALIAKGEKWSLIEYNNKQGYILNKYLKATN